MQILAEGTSTTESHDDDEDGNEEHSQEENCHFHAGVEYVNLFGWLLDTSD